MNSLQREKMRSAPGFVAALDQSGGSTPKALGLYGLEEGSWSSEQEMYDLIHQMRCRIITSPSFTGDRILAAILFEMTMERQVDGKGVAEFLWEDKQVVPFLKIDKGLAAQSDGAQVMKPIPDLDALLERALGHGVFGTKMRSVVTLADPIGIQAVVDQQLAIARQVLAAGLMPIVEPEVDIHSPQKAAAEQMLTERLLAALPELDDGQQVMLKLTLPEKDGLYAPLLAHPRVLRVVALSGGYTREEANARLSRNHGVVASFSRALTEGLSAQQSEVEFDRVLATSIQSIYDASVT
jgi:fructose-bisphosphate aldolase class I